MDIQSIKVILVIVLLSGIVAIVGDRIGRIAGKRKLNFLGMRPRLASSVIAVITGILIAVGTVAVLALSSRTVQEMLFHFDELKEDAKKLEIKAQQLEREVTSLEHQRETLNTELEITRKSLAYSQKQVTDLNFQIASTNKRLASIRLDLGKAVSQLEETKGRLIKTEANLKEMRKEVKALEETNILLKKEQQTLKDENERLEQTRANLTAAAKELEEKVYSLREGEIMLFFNQPLGYVKVPSEANLPQVRQILLDSLQQIQQNLKTKGLELDEKYSELLAPILDALSMLNQDAIVIIYSASNVLPGEKVKVEFEIALHKLIFRKGEVIAKVRIEPNIKGSDVASLLPPLLKTIRSIAIDRRLLPDIDTGEVGTISSDDIKELQDLLDRTSGARTLEILSAKDIYTTDKLDKFLFRMQQITN